MLQQPTHCSPPPQGERGSTVRGNGAGLTAFRLLCLIGIATMLAACGPCGTFLPSSQSQIGACHSDSPPQQ